MSPGMIIPIAIIGILGITAITIVAIVSWSRTARARIRAQGGEYGVKAAAKSQSGRLQRHQDNLQRSQLSHGAMLRRYEARLLQRNYGMAARMAGVGANAAPMAAARAAGRPASGMSGASGASGSPATMAARPDELIRVSRQRISRLEYFANKLADAELSAGVKRVCGIAGQIVQKASQKPELVKDIRFFLDYYLPVLAKIIENFDSLGIGRQSGIGSAPGSHAAETARSVQALVADVEVAFQKQLDALASDSLIDIEAEIRVFSRTLREDGFITEEDELQTGEEDLYDDEGLDDDVDGLYDEELLGSGAESLHGAEGLGSGYPSGGGPDGRRTRHRA